MATKKTTKPASNQEAAVKAGKDAKKVVLNSLNDTTIRDGLLDFGFTKWITPSVVKLLYIIAIAGILAIWIFLVIVALFENSVITFLGTLVIGAILSALGIIASRVCLETTVALIRVAQNTSKK